MTEEKKELRRHIQKIKNAKKDNLRSDELLAMFYVDKKYDGLMMLMSESNKSLKELKESVGKSWQNWNATYKDCYRKLSVPQVHLLATALDMSFNDLYDVILKDIKTQKK